MAFGHFGPLEPEPFEEYERPRQEGRLQRKRKGRGMFLRNTWVTEWFVISSEYLVSYASRTSSKVLRCISLSTVTKLEYDDSQNFFCVHYAPQLGRAPCDAGLELVLRGIDAGDVGQWTTAIQEAQERLRKDQVFVPLSCARGRVAAAEERAIKAEADANDAVEAVACKQAEAVATAKRAAAAATFACCLARIARIKCGSALESWKCVLAGHPSRMHKSSAAATLACYLSRCARTSYSTALKSWRCNLEDCSQYARRAAAPDDADNLLLSMSREEASCSACCDRGAGEEAPESCHCSDECVPFRRSLEGIVRMYPACHRVLRLAPMQGLAPLRCSTSPLTRTEAAVQTDPELFCAAVQISPELRSIGVQTECDTEMADPIVTPHHKPWLQHQTPSAATNQSEWLAFHLQEAVLAAVAALRVVSPMPESPSLTSAAAASSCQSELNTGGYMQVPKAPWNMDLFGDMPSVLLTDSIAVSPGCLEALPAQRIDSNSCHLAGLGQLLTPQRRRLDLGSPPSGSAHMTSQADREAVYASTALHSELLAMEGARADLPGLFADSSSTGAGVGEELRSPDGRVAAAVLPRHPQEDFCSASIGLSAGGLSAVRLGPSRPDANVPGSNSRPRANSCEAIATSRFLRACPRAGSLQRRARSCPRKISAWQKKDLRQRDWHDIMGEFMDGGADTEGSILDSQSSNAGFPTEGECNHFADTMDMDSTGEFTCHGSSDENDMLGRREIPVQQRGVGQWVDAQLPSSLGLSPASGSAGSVSNDQIVPPQSVDTGNLIANVSPASCMFSFDVPASALIASSDPTTAIVVGVAQGPEYTSNLLD